MDHFSICKFLSTKDRLLYNEGINKYKEFENDEIYQNSGKTSDKFHWIHLYNESIISLERRIEDLIDCENYSELNTLLKSSYENYTINNNHEARMFYELFFNTNYLITHKQFKEYVINCIYFDNDIYM